MKRSPLNRKTPLKRSTRLNPVSAKRAEQNAEYLKLREQYLLEHPWCERCPTLSNGARDNASCEVHHKAGRVGELLCDVRYFLATCRECHDAIHQNANLARKEGWIIDL